MNASTPSQPLLPDSLSALEQQERQRALVLNQWVILATITLSSTLSLALVPEGWQDLVVGFALYGTSTIVALLLARRGWVRTALIGHTIQVFACNLPALVVMQDLPAHMVLAMVNFVFLHAGILGRRAALLTTLAMIGCLVLASQLGMVLDSQLQGVRGLGGGRLGIAPEVELISLVTTALSTSVIIVTTLQTLDLARQRALASNRLLADAKKQLEARHAHARLLSRLGALAAAATSPARLREQTLSLLGTGLPGCTITTARTVGDSLEGLLLERLPVPLQLGFSPPLGADELRFAETVARLHEGAVARMVSDERLREAERLEGVGRLAASVAHDFNNLLVPVSAAAQLIERSEAHGRALETEVTTILEATARATAMVDKLLTHARSREPILRPVCLATLVRDREALLRSFLAEGQTLEVTTPSQPTVVHADPVELEQVLLNLVLNAMNAVSASGRIAVSVVQNNGIVLLEVRDDGPGVPEELRDWIFEPFHSTRAEGSGLGLATVARIVRSIEGTVRVLDGAEGGAVFRVELPRSASRVESPSVTSSPTVDSPSLSVLLVEDDPAVREAMQSMLMVLEHQVQVAKDGLDALELLGADPALQVVVTDFQMPLLNGEGLIREMRLRGDPRPVVMLSGYGAGLEPEKTEQAAQVLAKPVRLDALQRALCAAVD